MSAPPPPPPPDRSPALAYLWSAADYLDPAFYMRAPANEPPEGRTANWSFQGLTLSITKKLFSQAKPTNITYYVSLGDLTPGTKYLVAYVLNPRDDNLWQANRAAFKRCLEELYRKKDTLMFQSYA
ncbi:hypothetical protein V8D89_005209 [Ganoderma adspersum]